MDPIDEAKAITTGYNDQLKASNTTELLELADQNVQTLFDLLCRNQATGAVVAATAFHIATSAEILRRYTQLLERVGESDAVDALTRCCHRDIGGNYDCDRPATRRIPHPLAIDDDGTIGLCDHHDTER